MTTFKSFIIEKSNYHAALHKWEDMLHHIAEEELISCKVHAVELGDGNVIKFMADCNDKKRAPGYQADLSKKLSKRLTLHKLPGLPFPITAKVYHENLDPR